MTRLADVCWTKIEQSPTATLASAATAAISSVNVGEAAAAGRYLERALVDDGAHGRLMARRLWLSIGPCP